MTNIVKKLIELTDASKMQHRELSKRSGIDEQRICRYFKGKYEPSAFTLEKWAKALGYRIELVKDFEYPFNEPTVCDIEQEPTSPCDLCKYNCKDMCCLNCPAMAKGGE